MFRFFRENSYSIIKLYVNQIGIMIFSLALLFPIDTIAGSDGSSNLLSVVTSLLSIAFYYVLIYYAVWEIGAKDKIRVDSGRYERKRFKGLFIALWANVPNLILSIPHLIFTITAFLGGAGKQLYGALTAILRFHCSMYLGVILGITGFDVESAGAQIAVGVLFIVVPLLSVAVAHLAYALGSRDKRIFSFIAPKK